MLAYLSTYWKLTRDYSKENPVGHGGGPACLAGTGRCRRSAAAGVAGRRCRAVTGGLGSSVRLRIRGRLRVAGGLGFGCG